MSGFFARAVCFLGRGAGGDGRGGACVVSCGFVT